MMKHYILYIVFIFFVINCKTDKKKVTSSLANSVKIDSVIQQTEEQKEPKSLKEKLVGKTCDYLGSSDLEHLYMNGGFSIGTGYEERRVMDGKSFSIFTINGEKGNETSYSTFFILKQFHENENIPCKIVDVLDVGKETDLFKKYPNKDLDIMTNVSVNGKIDTELLALVEYEESDVMTNVYKVWRANRKTGKFEEVKDISGITVVNEDY